MSILPYLMNPQIGGGPFPPTAGAPRNDNPIARSLLGYDLPPSTGPGDIGGVTPKMRSQLAPADPMGGARVPGTAPLGESLTAKLAGLSLTPPAPHVGPPSGGKGRKVMSAILGVLGDGLLGYAGRPPVYTPFMQDQLQAQVDAERKQLERLSPRVEQVGNTVGWLNPGEGSFNPLYTAPSVAGQYALDRGFQPGTPEYQQAVADYRLGSWSDDAMAARRDLEGVRYDYRDKLQDQRLDVTRRGQDIRSTDTRRGQDMTAGTARRGQDMMDRRNIRDNDTRRGAASYTKGGNGPVAELNGRKIVVKGGKWVDAQTGQPVQ